MADVYKLAFNGPEIDSSMAASHSHANKSDLDQYDPALFAKSADIGALSFPVSPTHYELADFDDGFVWTAPEDGWLFVSGEDHGGLQGFVFVAIWVKPIIAGTAKSLSMAQCYAPGGYGADVRVAVPVRKGVSLTLNHNCTGAWYEFVY